MTFTLRAACFTAILACQAQAIVPSVKLNNGVDMPVIAFAAQVWHSDVCKSATTSALEAGFRFVWSSILVGADCQKSQGEAISASGIPRTELFLAGTVNTKGCSGLDSCYQRTKADAAEQFKSLKADTLDMLMLDYPASEKCDDIQGQWKAFEELYAAKLVRAISVSNFSPKQLECITSNKTATVPAVNQMPYSVGHGSDTVVSDNAKYGIVVQAYSPLGSGNLAHDPDCVKIGKAYGKSSAQVAFRWILQHKVTIATQSTSVQHLKEDLDIFDFKLSDSDMKVLDSRSGSLDRLIV
eukprot:TRINITY_DN2158_c2_g2_i1.p1 TRINITY_DN2158_c2_g2~~TRINITY_DN2158_c2_g2_i1.p1  ORF type:complete len:297 (-),score=54.41 TRINITY_DN2158_c2_g2_i1:73-963(-)